MSDNKTFSRFSIIDFGVDDFKIDKGTVKRTGNALELSAGSQCTFSKSFKYEQSKTIPEIKALIKKINISDKTVSKYDTLFNIVVKIRTYIQDGETWVIGNDVFTGSVILSGSSDIECEFICLEGVVAEISVSVKNDLNCTASSFISGFYALVDFDDRINEANAGVLIKELHVMDLPDQSYKITAVLNNGNTVDYVPKYQGGKLVAIDISHGLYVPVYYGKEV